VTAAEVRAGLRRFICAELLGDPSYPLADDEPLITGGLIDSFALAHVAVFVESAFGVYLPDVELTVEAMDTVALMAARVLAER
jgi:acyl carrier protein